MGQYYKPMLLKERKVVRARSKKIDSNLMYGYFETWDWENGSKLMEHSYYRNHLIGGVLVNILKVGGARVVWCGDYADDEKKNIGNLYELVREREDIVCIAPTMGKDAEYDANYELLNQYNYIVNHDKKLALRLHRPDKGEDWCIHPLPILTAEGNGRGGGDFRTEDIHVDNLVGSWARDYFTIEKELPMGIELFEVEFVED